ncbi:flagellar motor switch protein FliM [Candidatus Acetothermia bacterium]|nr:MAG: flagellar motor switch protein FliM [Candidatus Acetothermia bacterium]
MAEILSQSEIDELLEQFQQGAIEIDQAEPEGLSGDERLQKSVVVYDFRHPNRVTREQIRTLRVIHETFAKQVESYLSTRLRTLISSKVEAADQVTYSEFQLSLSDPSCICVIGAEEFKSDFVIELNPTLTFFAVDKLFGGVGGPPSEFRELSLIEQRVVRRLVEGILKYYDEAWKPVCDIHCKLKAMQSRPSLTQVIAPGETVVAVSIGFTAGDIAGGLNICLPYIMLEDLLPNMSAGKVAFGTRVKRDKQTREAIERNIRSTPIPVQVQLGEAKITLRDLLELQEGDVLVLDTHVDDPLPLDIGGEVRAYGKPGLRRRTVAVRVEQVLEGNE